MTAPFVTASWEHLLILNWACPAALLEPLVPEGTTLDPWDGQALVSLVDQTLALDMDEVRQKIAEHEAAAPAQA